MFSCRRASRLMSDAQDRRLTWRERVSLRVHLCICRYCRKAQKHFRFLQSLGQLWHQHGEGEGAETRLPDDARQRILERLRG